MQFKGVLPIGAVLLSAASLHAQLAFQGDYLETFDPLGPTGTTLPPGWSAVRHAGSGILGADLNPGVTAGTATGGGIYNVGTAGAPDRALGSLSSSSTIPRFGLHLLNASGSTYDTLTLGGVMEQWRTGSSAAALESLAFEYSLNASGIHDAAGLWTMFPDLNLSEKLAASTSSGAVDGNLPANQWNLSGLVTGLNWIPGQTLTLRWTDTDDPGSDGLYALDNFQLTASVTPVPEPAGLGTVALGLLALAGFRWRQQRYA
jgi:hypothetical protein